MSRPYQVCARCVMDTTDANIVFDAEGICSHCRKYEREILPSRPPPEVLARQFDEMVAEIRHAGRNKAYDCVLGLSGGMDSSYVAYLAWTNGLRPLAVHLDNGWDAELAVKNIENILRVTKFEYLNHVVDWEEFRDLQLAFLRASVIDVEVVTDHAIFALLHQAAYRLGVPYILFGGNPYTESIMPVGWNFRYKNDLAHLLAIHRRFGGRPLKTFPRMGQFERSYYRIAGGIHYASILRHVAYDYHEALATLGREFGWRNYEWKHCESVFTKFYQGYILPRKYNVDKRRAHLSDLILSGEISRDEALAKLAAPCYDEESLRKDYDFVLRKLGLSAAEFEALMALPPVSHEAYPLDRLTVWQRLRLSGVAARVRVAEGAKGVGRAVLGTRLWAAGRSRWHAKERERQRSLKEIGPR